MDKIKEILDVILSEAEEQAKQIIAKADAEIAKNSSQTDLDIFELTEEVDRQIHAEVDAIYTRNDSIIESKTRQLRLEQRQQLIQSIIDDAVNQFRTLDEDKKVTLYKSFVNSRHIIGGTISLNREDQGIMGRLLEELGDQFSAGPEANIKGGLLVVHDRIEENLSLDLILRDKRAELSSLAANLLFS